MKPFLLALLCSCSFMLMIPASSNAQSGKSGYKRPSSSKSVSSSSSNDDAARQAREERERREQEAREQERREEAARAREEARRESEAREQERREEARREQAEREQARREETERRQQAEREQAAREQARRQEQADREAADRARAEVAEEAARKRELADQERQALKARIERERQQKIEEQTRQHEQDNRARQVKVVEPQQTPAASTGRKVITTNAKPTNGTSEGNSQPDAAAPASTGSSRPVVSLELVTPATRPAGGKTVISESPATAGTTSPNPAQVKNPNSTRPNTRPSTSSPVSTSNTGRNIHKSDPSRPIPGVAGIPIIRPGGSMEGKPIVPGAATDTAGTDPGGGQGTNWEWDNIDWNQQGYCPNYEENYGSEWTSYEWYEEYETYTEYWYEYDIVMYPVYPVYHDYHFFLPGREFMWDYQNGTISKQIYWIEASIYQLLTWYDKPDWASNSFRRNVLAELNRLDEMLRLAHKEVDILPYVQDYLWFRAEYLRISSNLKDLLALKTAYTQYFQEKLALWDTLSPNAKLFEPKDSLHATQILQEKNADYLAWMQKFNPQDVKLALEDFKLLEPWMQKGIPVAKLENGMKQFLSSEWVILLRDNAYQNIAKSQEPNIRGTKKGTELLQSAANIADAILVFEPQAKEFIKMKEMTTRLMPKNEVR